MGRHARLQQVWLAMGHIASARLFDLVIQMGFTEEDKRVCEAERDAANSARYDACMVRPNIGLLFCMAEYREMCPGGERL